MQSVKQKKEFIGITLALYGYGIDTWSPGDGMTRYRITESAGIDYFATYGVFTGTLNEVYTYCKALRHVYYHMPTQHSTGRRITLARCQHERQSHATQHSTPQAISTGARRSRV